MKKKRRFGGDDELNITSMMDMMTIILVFLLKSVGASEVEVKSNENMKLPYSTNKSPPSKVTVNVMVQKDVIIVEPKTIVDVSSEIDPNMPGNHRTYFVDSSEKTGLSINKLFDELNDRKETAKLLGAKSKKDALKFNGKMILQFDQNIPYSLIREVMFTAGKAEFFDFQLVLIQK